MCLFARSYKYIDGLYSTGYWLYFFMAKTLLLLLLSAKLAPSCSVLLNRWQSRLLPVSVAMVSALRQQLIKEIEVH